MESCILFLVKRPTTGKLCLTKCFQNITINECFWSFAKFIETNASMLTLFVVYDEIQEQVYFNSNTTFRLVGSLTEF